MFKMHFALFVKLYKYYCINNLEYYEMRAYKNLIAIIVAHNSLKDLIDLGTFNYIYTVLQLHRALWRQPSDTPDLDDNISLKFLQTVCYQL